jgi:nitric oxide reductase subunit C
MPAAIATAAQATQAPSGGPAPGPKDPAALGEQVFRTATPACVACHSTAPGVNLAGPSLAGVSARAEKLLQSGQYTGKAKDVAGYIRESIMQPSAHVVPGPMYSANGVSFMPTTFGKDLTPEQIDDLVAYLSTLK